MEGYSSPDQDELGRIEVKNVSAFVILVGEGGFSNEDNHSIEVVEGVDNYFVLVNREMVERAMGTLDPDASQETKLAVIGQVLGAAASRLSEWLDLQGK